ncbi:GGDEF domain-containing protein [Leucobacter chromiisoli]|nr:GGDEF domain-containing protein [Leucobacter chromiisoli]
MRRGDDRLTALLGAVRSRVRRAIAWQTSFSVVSALMAGLLATVFLVDLVVRHPGFQERPVSFWFLSYLAAALLPLILGRRYPPLMGLLVVGFMNVWTFYFVAYAGHAHGEVNALLQMPIIALYLGWFYSASLGRYLMLATFAVAILAGVLNPNTEGDPFSTIITVSYAVAIAGFCFEGARVVRRQSEIEAVLDPLTGALNRRGLVEFGEDVIAAAQRRRAPLTLIVIDFDDFKLLNDAAGHAAGDAVLVDAAGLWRDAVGSRGIIARSGGDEFVLLLHAELEAARVVVGDLRAAAAHPWSWGAAELRAGEGLDELVARADEELYRAKEARARE